MNFTFKPRFSYERLFPIYNYQVYNGSYEAPYTNPRAPVHIITGSAGCKEKTDTFPEIAPGWSAYRSSDYGYTRMTAHNKTHLYFEQVSDDKLGAVIDSVWVIKTERKAYPLAEKEEPKSEEHKPNLAHTFFIPIIYDFLTV